MLSYLNEGLRFSCGKVETPDSFRSLLNFLKGLNVVFEANDENTVVCM